MFKKSSVISFVSGLFSMAFLLTVHMNNKTGVFAPWKMMDIFLYIGIFLLTDIVLFGLSKAQEKYYIRMERSSQGPLGVLPKNKRTIPVLSHRMFFILSVVVIMGSFFLCLLTFFPGVASYDTLYILMYDTDMSKQHPMAYCTLIKILKLFGNTSMGLSLSVFLYSILQILMIGLAAAFGLTWLRKKGCPAFVLGCGLVYYIFTPILSMYAITMIKDSLYAAFAMCMIPFLFEVVESKGEFLKTKMGLVSGILILLGTALLRSNGVYMVLPLLLVLGVMVKYGRKQLILLGILTLMFHAIPGAYMSLHGNQALFQEKAGILLGQVAAVVASDEELTEREEQFLNTLMPLSEIKSNYRSTNIDSIKWNSQFDRVFLDENQDEFMQIWLGMLPKHFPTYVKAFLFQTSGFWQTRQEYAIFYNSLDSSSGDAILQNYVAENHLYNEQILPDGLYRILENWYLKESVFFSDGICFWIVIVLGMLLFMQKKEYAILVLPILFNWATIMISTPISIQFRYILMTPFSLPILIGVLFLIKDKVGKGNACADANFLPSVCESDIL